MFIPRTLTSSWYRDHVFQSVPSNLEGMVKWNSVNIQNKNDREAYMQAANACIMACKDACDIRVALEELQHLRARILSDAPIRSRFHDWHPLVIPSEILKMTSAAADVHRYRLLAVDHCIALVENTRDRYLVN